MLLVNSFKQFVISIIVAIVLVGCHSIEKKEAKISEVVQKGIRSTKVALEEGDVENAETFAGLTEIAADVPPDMKPLKGKRGVEAYKKEVATAEKLKKDVLISKNRSKFSWITGLKFSGGLFVVALAIGATIWAYLSWGRIAGKAVGLLGLCLVGGYFWIAYKTYIILGALVLGSIALVGGAIYYFKTHGSFKNLISAIQVWKQNGGEQSSLFEHLEKVLPQSTKRSITKFKKSIDVKKVQQK